MALSDSRRRPLLSAPHRIPCRRLPPFPLLATTFPMSF
jgi:hypothetical protein